MTKLRVRPWRGRGLSRLGSGIFVTSDTDDSIRVLPLQVRGSGRPGRPGPTDGPERLRGWCGSESPDSPLAQRGAMRTRRSGVRPKAERRTWESDRAQARDRGEGKEKKSLGRRASGPSGCRAKHAAEPRAALRGPGPGTALARHGRAGASFVSVSTEPIASASFGCHSRTVDLPSNRHPLSPRPSRAPPPAGRVIVLVVGVLLARCARPRRAPGRRLEVTSSGTVLRPGGTGPGPGGARR